MAAASQSSGSRRLLDSSAFWGGVSLTALLLFNLCFTDGFFHLEARNGCLYGSLVDILDRAAPILLVSLGMTLVIATGGVDLSVGAIMAIAGTVTAALVARPDYSPLTRLGLPPVLPVAIGGALFTALLAGALNGALVAWARIQPIVATLFLMVAGRGAAQLLAQGQVVAFQHPGLAFLGNGYLLGLPVSVAIAFAAYALVGALVRRTALGLFIEALGDNRKSAHRSGVPVAGVILFAYTVSAICSAAAGILVVADIRAADANNAGLYAELDAILAVVIGGANLSGGRIHLGGTILGVLILQTLTTTILTRGVPIEYTLLMKSLVIVALCLSRSPAFWSRLARKPGRGA